MLLFTIVFNGAFFTLVSLIGIFESLKDSSGISFHIGSYFCSAIYLGATFFAAKFTINLG